MQLTESQARVVALLAERLQPHETVERLGTVKQRYYTIRDELAEIGLLRQQWELPAGAKSSVHPRPERMDANAQAMSQTGWDPDLVRRLLLDDTKAGMMPPDADGAYTREGWEGYTIRRVEWSYSGNRWVVQGLLVPRADGRPWSAAAPVWRTVLVSMGEEFWRPVGQPVERRGLIVPIDMIRRSLPKASPHEHIGLTMATAWVLESRALLDVESLSSWVLR